MKAIAFKVRLNSLFSIRIPYTWQSALTYPIPPPSTIIGMLANALQRVKSGKHPLTYLDEVEKNVLWVGARLVSPSIIKSYITSAITNWEIKPGKKSTNVLGREYSFTRNMEIVAIIKNDEFAGELLDALKVAPITCGDSESLSTIEYMYPLLECEEIKENPPARIETAFPFPFQFERMELLGNESGLLYMVHERCKKEGKNFPLKNYIFPIEKKNGIYHPTKICVNVKTPITTIKIQKLGKIIKKID